MDKVIINIISDFYQEFTYFTNWIMIFTDQIMAVYWVNHDVSCAIYTVYCVNDELSYNLHNSPDFYRLNRDIYE